MTPSTCRYGLLFVVTFPQILVPVSSNRLEVDAIEEIEEVADASDTDRTATNYVISTGHGPLSLEVGFPAGFDGKRKLEFEVLLVWQNNELAKKAMSKDNMICTIDEADAHRQFLFVDANDWKHNYCHSVSNFQSVYLQTSHLCGANQFTQPALTCTTVQRSDFDHYLASAISITPRGIPPRAFGVELELVGREPKEEFGQKVGDFFSLDGRLRHLKSCHSKKVANWGADSKNICQLNITEQARYHHGCPRGEYCRKQDGKHPNSICKSAWKCTPEKSIDEKCPLDQMMVPPKKWTWTSDGSVFPLSAQEAAAVLGLPKDSEAVQAETAGIPFELVSPVLSGQAGLASLVETLGTLRDLGIQSGPTQGMHVHVNVGKCKSKNPNDCKTKAPGDIFNAEQIFNVWAHYARFQYVIDEMLLDSRVGNTYAVPLAFGSETKVRNWKTTPTPDGVSFDVSQAPKKVKKIFDNMQDWLRNHGKDRNADHCNTILFNVDKPAWGERGRREGTVQEYQFNGTYKDVPWKPCNERYPLERYMQLNLVPLDRLGTIEFRGYGATTDPAHALEWVQFILQFVEHYKDDNRFAPKNSSDYVMDSELIGAQRRASLDDLESEMNVDVSYWRQRPWLGTSLPCAGVAEDCERSVSDDEVRALQESMLNGDYVPIVLGND